MGDKVSFSEDILTFENVAMSHSDTEICIRFYYSMPSIERHNPKFIGYRAEDLTNEQAERLDDLDRNSSFGVLSALEASFRVDFLLRCYKREKDDLSRYFRDIYKNQNSSVSFEENILEGWKIHHPENKTLISEVKGAFRYRHWIAHGCYWEPKLGRKFDFLYVYLLAQSVNQTLPLKSF
jgi:hypothetical protein